MILESLEKKGEVDALLQEGKRTSEIAQELGVSEGYVRARRHLMAKRANRDKARVLDTLRQLSVAAPGLPLADAIRAAEGSPKNDD